MPNEFSRNTQDADLSKSIALPSSAAAVTSPDIDLGTNSKGFFTENHELEIIVPSLTATQLPSASTITILLQNGAAASPTTATQFSRVITGTGSTLPETVQRIRLPSGILRYVNVKFTAAGSPGATLANSAATVKLLT